MTITTLPFDEVPLFAARDRAYAMSDPRLSPFYKYAVEMGSFHNVLRDKSKEKTPRELLVKVLEKQNAGLSPSEAVRKNIQRLSDPTGFTVTTAHQPALFTGPLYFIYKIISTIHLARQIDERYPEVNIVPVMIIGGEDHDFAEINHAHLFGRKLNWETEAGGPVGRLGIDSLQPVLEELMGLLGDSPLREALQSAFTGQKTYGRAMQEFVHFLFKDYGLLVLNMDDPDLKRHFIPWMRKELLERPSQALVEETQAELEALGFPAQAHARPINLFYLPGGARERIVFEEGVYQVLQTDLRFTEAEILSELEAHPERFSPNVVMRPLYQEVILPNLAYVGGGGELAYWLERKRQFEYFGVNFPMLVRRNSALWIDGGGAKRMQKLGVGLQDLMGDTEELIKNWVLNHSEQTLSLAAQLKRLQEIFDETADLAQSVDPTLVGTVRAEGAKQAKSLEQLEGRLLRAQKQQFETELNQIRSLKEKLFPGGGLQERHDNFIPFFHKHGNTFLETLLTHLDPLRTDFIVIQE